MLCQNFIKKIISDKLYNDCNNSLMIDENKDTSICIFQIENNVTGLENSLS